MNKKIISLTLAICIAQAMALPAYASSPEFSRTQAEWESLRDNKLEYSELEGLIEEYNATVQKNQIDYYRFRQDYGDTKDEVSQSYYDMASDLEDAIDVPASTDASYATALITSLSNQNSARTLRESGDNNLEDSEIKRINNEMTLKTLVQTAQNNMVSYKIAQLDVEKAKLNEELAKLNLEIAMAKSQIGSATAVDVYNSQQSLLSSQQAVTTAEASENTSHKKLIVMCGWSYDDSPEIGDIPEPDLSAIGNMNVTEDTAKAIENSYTIKSNTKQLSNATQQSQIDKLNTTIANNKANVGTAVSTAYQNVISARDTYTYAATYASLQKTNLDNITVSYSVGSASKLEYDTQNVNTKLADIALKEASYNLFLAINAYNWTINGLASA